MICEYCINECGEYYETWTSSKYVFECSVGENCYDYEDCLNDEDCPKFKEEI